jgi:serine/threonine protein kinase
LGRVVGQGGFSVVSEIKSIDLDDIYDTEEAETANRKDFASAVRTGGGFVLKSLRTDLPEEEYDKGVTDLAIEADFLSVLQHPHIVTMRAMANTDPARPRFFVVLDNLHPTLEGKFNYWRRIVQENTGYWVPCWGYCCARTPVLHANWKDRLQCALDIASALEYLHSRNIVYRDCKPDNIGFDRTGCLKLFDFGLAKRLDHVEQIDNNTYKLTGNTGSLRYMSPEVALDQPYDLTVDCYSFGILFWQICSLQTPFAGYSPRLHSEKVVHKGQRPKPDRSWPKQWVRLMTSSWSPNRLERPAMASISVTLQEFLNELAGESMPESHIKAQKRVKPVTAENHRLDVDTRISTEYDKGIKRFVDEDIV